MTIPKIIPKFYVFSEELGELVYPLTVIDFDITDPWGMRFTEFISFSASAEVLYESQATPIYIFTEPEENFRIYKLWSHKGSYLVILLGRFLHIYALN